MNINLQFAGVQRNPTQTQVELQTKLTAEHAEMVRQAHHERPSSNEPLILSQSKDAISVVMLEVLSSAADFITGGPWPNLEPD